MKLAVFAKGSVIYLVSEHPRRAFRGVARGTSLSSSCLHEGAVEGQPPAGDQVRDFDERDRHVVHRRVLRQLAHVAADVEGAMQSGHRMPRKSVVHAEPIPSGAAPPAPAQPWLI
jgi:hypothetical protein